MWLPPNRKSNFETFSCTFNPCAEVSNICEVKNLSLIVENKDKYQMLMHSLIWGPFSSSVCLGRHDVTHMINTPGPSPSYFSYCKQSKTGQWKGLGKRVCAHTHAHLYILTSIRSSPHAHPHTCVQLNLRTKDTLGMGLLSFVRRLSLSRRFKCVILK